MSSLSSEGAPLLREQLPGSPESPQENPFPKLPDELLVLIASKLAHVHSGDTIGAIDSLLALRATDRRWRRILTKQELSKIAMEPLRPQGTITNPLNRTEQRFLFDLIQTDRWAKKKLRDGVYHWKNTFQSSIEMKIEYIRLLQRALNLPLPTLQEAIQAHNRLHCPVYCGGVPLLVTGITSTIIRLSACQNTTRFFCELQKPIQILSLFFGVPLSIVTIFSLRKKRRLAAKLQNLTTRVEDRDFNQIDDDLSFLSGRWIQFTSAGATQSTVTMLFHQELVRVTKKFNSARFRAIKHMIDECEDAAAMEKDDIHRAWESMNLTRDIAYLRFLSSIATNQTGVS